MVCRFVTITPMKRSMNALFALTLFLPLTAFALTQSEKESLVQSLLQQVAVLQAQINTIIAQQRGTSPTTGQTGSASVPQATALQLIRNLYLGVKGDDVSVLQQFLRQTGDFTYGEITGYYGFATAQAVQRYQCREMRICFGSPESNGYGVVGPKTRAAIGTLQASIASITATTTPGTKSVSPTGEGGSATSSASSPVTMPTITVLPGSGTDLATCFFENQSIAHGTGVTAYQANIVPHGSKCVSQTRACNNGVLSGSYTHGRCSVAPMTYMWQTGEWSLCTGNIQTRKVVCKDTAGVEYSDALCTTPKPSSQQSCGSTGTASCMYHPLSQPVPHGNTRYFYSVGSSNSCTTNRVTKTCQDGVWIGDDNYTFAQCFVSPQTATISATSATWTEIGPKYIPSGTVLSEYAVADRDIVVTGLSFSTEWKKGATGDFCLFVYRDQQPVQYGLYSGGYSDQFCLNINQLGNDAAWQKSYDLSQHPIFIPKGTRFRCNTSGGDTATTVGKRSCTVSFKTYTIGESRYRVFRNPFFDLAVSAGQKFLPSFYKATPTAPIKVRGFYLFDAAYAAEYTACLYKGDGATSKCVHKVKMTTANEYSPDFIPVDNWVYSPTDTLYAQCTVTNNPYPFDCAFYIVVEIPPGKAPGPEDMFRDPGNINPTHLKSWCTTYVDQYILPSQKQQLCAYDASCYQDTNNTAPIQKCIDAYQGE